MALTVDIKVTPKSGRQAWKKKNDVLLCYLKSAPEKGKANKELISFISQSLAIPQAQIVIVRGETIRFKRVVIDAPLSMEQFLERIGIQDQLGLFDS